jgi:1-deoxy-D-xylulose-5-phosphate synthase
MIALAKELAVRALEREGYSAAVINPRFIKPLDREMLERLRQARRRLRHL